ncbi:MAG: hypothetical protein IJD22_05070 [Clostridia bacterium]|nr:hypothetical protein [Clostridia bacterium]
MKKIVCEMCQGSDFTKQSGEFICNGCGMKYSLEEAKALMVDDGEAPAPAASASNSQKDTELENLYVIARRAKDSNDSEGAQKYYEMITMKDPTSWEAAFFSVYYKSMSCKIAEIQSAAIQVSNCYDTVLGLVKDHVQGEAEQVAALKQIATHAMSISIMLFNAAKSYYDGIDISIKSRYTQEYVNRGIASVNVAYILGGKLDSQFGSYAEVNNLSVMLWKTGVSNHKLLVIWLSNKEAAKNEIIGIGNHIRKYEPSYTDPEIKTSGCYVATAVYGSYDCPQVWTLRRYRDNTLAKTWYGRAFIRTYYAISPTLVKWFGHTDWFKNMWKGKLDSMVEKLNSEGVEDTPYEDKEW